METRNRSDAARELRWWNATTGGPTSAFDPVVRLPDEAPSGFQLHRFGKGGAVHPGPGLDLTAPGPYNSKLSTVPQHAAKPLSAV